jgi:hypothetical protein
MRSRSRSLHQPERRRLIAARSSANVDWDGAAGLREAAFFVAFFGAAFFTGFFMAFFTVFFALVCFAISVFPPGNLLNAGAHSNAKARDPACRFWILPDCFRFNPKSKIQNPKSKGPPHGSPE